MKAQESTPTDKTDLLHSAEWKLDERALELIAIGVSVAVNCQDCLKHHAHRAMESGADEKEIVDAVKVGMMVRKGAASIMDRFVAREAAKVGCNEFAEQEAMQSECGCH